MPRPPEATGDRALTPDRWNRVEALFQDALDRAAGDRAAFLSHACAGDDELLREVESLLLAHGNAGGFLADAGPASDASGKGSSPDDAPTLAAGTRLGPYEVLGLLATGGMGEVYRARDLRLGRDVAMKVLPRAWHADAGRLRRFHQEARAAGALNHPNILAVYDVGEEGSLPFVVSELLAGETLRARLARGTIPLSEALGLARQLASGLLAAHDKGIVHRDIKPDNVFVTMDGRLKVLDFGLAKQSGASEPDSSARTGPGVVLGTVGYMAPEQVRGQPADMRADLFAFGAVLYEVLSGRRAFGRGADADVMGAILREEPDLAALPSEAPPAIAALLRACLQKDAAHRPASARDLLSALDDAEREHAAGERAGRRLAVAVLPFRSLLRDAEAGQLGLGLADAAITELAQVRSLVVRPTSAVLRFLDAPADPREVGRSLGVDAVVDGTLHREGARVRVTVQLVDVASGRTLWAAKIDGTADQLFRMQDDVARRVTEALALRLTPGDERRLDRHQLERAAAGDAYALYVKGKAHLLRESLEECIAAVDWFEKAREADPSFALAWAGLADAYVRVAFEFQPEGDWYVRAQAMCAQALALDPQLPEARYVRGRLLWSPHGRFDHAGGLRELSAAVVGRPNLDVAWVRLGVQLFHVGLIEEAEGQLRRALSISPGNVIGRGHLASCRYHAGDFAQALALAEVVLRESRSSWHQYVAAHSLLRLDRRAEAAELAERLQDHEEGVAHGHALHGLVAALGGDAGEAERRIALTVETRRAYGHYHHDQYDVACIHALLGRPDQALRWLTDAARNGYPCHPFFERDPLLARLRGHAGFGALQDQLRTECAGYARLWAQLREGLTSGG